MLQLDLKQNKDLIHKWEALLNLEVLVSPIKQKCKFIEDGLVGKYGVTFGAVLLWGQMSQTNQAIENWHLWTKLNRC